VDATDPFSLTEALESSPRDFAGASDSILVATAHGAGGAVSEAMAFLLSNETNANATDDARARAARDAPRCPGCSALPERIRQACFLHRRSGLSPTCWSDAHRAGSLAGCT